MKDKIRLQNRELKSFEKRTKLLKEIKKLENSTNQQQLNSPSETQSDKPTKKCSIFDHLENKAVISTQSTKISSSRGESDISASSEYNSIVSEYNLSTVLHQLANQSTQIVHIHTQGKIVQRRILSY